MLFHKGDAGNPLYGILSGSLKVMATGSDGKDVTFTLMGPGEVIVEIPLFDAGERSASAVAVCAGDPRCRFISGVLTVLP